MVKEKDIFFETKSPNYEDGYGVTGIRGKNVLLLNTSAVGGITVYVFVTKRRDAVGDFANAFPIAPQQFMKITKCPNDAVYLYSGDETTFPVIKIAVTEAVPSDESDFEVGGI